MKIVKEAPGGRWCPSDKEEEGRTEGGGRNGEGE